MAEKTVAVVGAGLAGLSAGCYARMNGFKTQIFEQHAIPGGLCTSWKRGGYRINGCVHWLMGTRPRPHDEMYAMWAELGAVQGQEWVEFDEYLRFTDASGETLILYTDLDKLEQHLLQRCPEDREPIGELLDTVRRVQKVGIPAAKDPSLCNFFDRVGQAIGMWPLIRRKKTWFDLNLDQYSERFQNPLLRSAIRASFAPDFPAFFLVITMAGLANGSSRYPIGGSLAIARRIEQRYRRLGGSIRYGAAVDRILVEDDRAVGVRLEDGTELRADYVIGAGDVHHAVNHMLEGRYGADWLEDLEDRLAVFPTMLLISLGVNQSYADHPAQALGTYHVLDRPLGHAAVDPRIVLTHVYSFERGDCADGKTVFTIATLVDYEHWTGLRRSDPERYEREKEDVARRIIRSLDRHYPGLEQNVEMIDVATPATFERYTFNWRGSIEGWLLRPSDLTARVSKTLPGLERFYQVGHWIEPGGGLPMAAASGRWGVQLICRAEGRRFRTRLPDAADAASEPAHASI